MATPTKPESSTEIEHGDVHAAARGTIEYERAQLLASLPDPDAGKSEEERAAIVSRPSNNALVRPQPLTHFGPRPRTRS